jgi:hypothetical protein
MASSEIADHTGSPYTSLNPLPVKAVGAGTTTELVDSSGNPIGILGNPLRINPTGTTNQPVNLFDGSGNAISSTAGAINVSASFSANPNTSSSSACSAINIATSTSTYNTVKASAGNLYGLNIFNSTNSVVYLNFYNSTAPTIGTTSIVLAIAIQAGTSITIPPGIFALANFSSGITTSVTTTNGGSGVCASGLVLNVFYA